jgi:hypothetical protein
MSKAIALGFYAKHPLIMDELGDLEDFDDLKDAEGLPVALIELVSAHANLLTKLFNQVDAELDPFEEQLNADLQALIARGAKILPSRPSQWEGKVKAAPRRGRATQAPLEFGWSWHTEGNEIFFDPWVWMKGGRAAERRLAALLSQIAPQLRERMTPASELEEGAWYPGAIRLGRINVGERVDEEFGLDLDALHKDALEFFRWADESHLRQLFEETKA